MTKSRRELLRVVAVSVLVIVFYHFVCRAPNKIVGPSRWDMVTTEGLHALDDGNFSDADRKLTDALNEAERTPEIPMRRATSLQNLGDLRVVQHRLDDACTLYRESLDALEAIPAAPVMQRALVADHLAVALMNTMQLDQAEPYFARAVDLSKNASGTDERIAARIMRHYAGFLLTAGQTKKSLEWVTKAEAIERHATTQTP